MHRLNVLIYASNSFVSTLNELKPFLKFNHFSDFEDKSYDIILFHEESLKDNKKKNQISKSHSLKIFVSNKNKKPSIDYDEHLQIPTTLKEINNTVEKIVAYNCCCNSLESLEYTIKDRISLSLSIPKALHKTNKGIFISIPKIRTVIRYKNCLSVMNKSLLRGVYSEFILTKDITFVLDD